MARLRVRIPDDERDPPRHVRRRMAARARGPAAIAPAAPAGRGGARAARRLRQRRQPVPRRGDPARARVRRPRRARRVADAPRCGRSSSRPRVHRGRGAVPAASPSDAGAARAGGPRAAGSARGLAAGRVQSARAAVHAGGHGARDGAVRPDACAPAGRIVARLRTQPRGARRRPGGCARSWSPPRSRSPRLLVATALVLSQSFARLQAVDPGFRAGSPAHRAALAAAEPLSARRSIPRASSRRCARASWRCRASKTPRPSTSSR